MSSNFNRPEGCFAGLSRRESLRLGILGGVGLTLPTLLGSRAAQAANPKKTGSKAKACILLYMYGGPAHQDIWDLKPEAPTEIRGEFKPIATSVPGIRIGEHLPHLAKQAHRYAIIRSLTHTDSTHETAFYAMLAGRVRDPGLGITPLASDYPHIGSVVAKVREKSGVISPFVATRDTIENGGGEQHYPGLGPGFLGPKYAATVLHSDNLHQPDFHYRGLSLAAGLSPERFDERRRLLNQVNRQGQRKVPFDLAQAKDAHFDQAVSLLTSPQARRALDLDKEPRKVREQYGMTLYGQHLLLARRLVEAGVSLVTVYWNQMLPRGDISPGQPFWDTHKNNFVKLKDHLLPSVDRPISVLLDDLAQRGLLDQTLVVWMSEFGRTPKIDKDAQGGRHHWPHANSVVLAGGGIQGGQVYGATDKHAAFPAADPVTPGDLAATIYHGLGMDPDTEIHDRLNRPYRITEGIPLTKLYQ
ncbi:MAG: DUF1501 domain-containing protein [Planctomycetota bacterium]|nr:DUF1501 domain-containing protein [Planctomycetota bacterium]